LGVVVTKTALGVQVMKDRSVSLSAQQRSALILCDGKRTADEVLRMTAGVGVTLQDLEVLASKGLIDVITNSPVEQGGALAVQLEPASQPVSAPPRKADFRQARDTAITLCADLGFKGFSLNIAVVDADSMDKLKKLAPEIRRLAGDAKYRPLHEQIFGETL
jgi:hypothetical protein